MATYRNTPEQDAVIETVADGASVAVQACAGAGKTSTLVATANAQAHKTFLYVAYNKALQVEAQSKMPSHVISKTTHGLAWSQEVSRDGRTGRFRSDEIGSARGAQVAAALGIENSLIFPGRTITPTQLAYLALAVVRAWCYSADREIQSKHFRPGKYGVTLTADEVGMMRQIVMRMAHDLIGLWLPRESHRRPGSASLKIPHDLYLKLYVQDVVDGKVPPPAQRVIMVDELQDSNAVTLQFIEHLSGIGRQIVAVGDPYQQIYEWRGSEDAFSRIKTDQRLRLSQSFRFGPETAALANAWLKVQFGIAEDLVTGTPSKSTPVDPKLREKNASMVICRSNKAVAESAIHLMEANRQVYIPKGTEVSEEIAAIHDLQQGRRTQHHEYQAYASYDELLEHADSDDGQRIKTLIQMMNAHGAQSLIESLRKAGEAYAQMERRKLDSRGGAIEIPGVLVCTAHASKGLESAQVVLAEDFNPRKSAGALAGESGAAELAPEDVRLLYVAMTRAKEANNPLAANPVRVVYEALTGRKIESADVRAPDEQKPEETASAPQADVSASTQKRPRSKKRDPKEAMRCAREHGFRVISDLDEIGRFRFMGPDGAESKDSYGSASSAWRAAEQASSSADPGQNEDAHPSAA